MFGVFWLSSLFNLIFVPILIPSIVVRFPWFYTKMVPWSTIQGPKSYGDLEQNFPSPFSLSRYFFVAAFPKTGSLSINGG